MTTLTRKFWIFIFLSIQFNKILWIWKTFCFPIKQFVLKLGIRKRTFGFVSVINTLTVSPSKEQLPKQQPCNSFGKLYVGHVNIWRSFLLPLLLLFLLFSWAVTLLKIFQFNLLTVLYTCHDGKTFDTCSSG